MCARERDLRLVKHQRLKTWPLLQGTVLTLGRFWQNWIQRLALLISTLASFVLLYSGLNKKKKYPRIRDIAQFMNCFICEILSSIFSTLKKITFLKGCFVLNSAQYIMDLSVMCSWKCCFQVHFSLWLANFLRGESCLNKQWLILPMHKVE